MPHPHQREGDHRVHEAPRRPVPVAPDRDVDVVANPAGERHVPALPEVLQVPGKVGPAEVLRQGDPEELRQPDRDVAVSGEVHEDSERYGDQHEPPAENPDGGKLGLGRVYVEREVVGYGHLLREADADPEEPLANGIQPEPPASLLKRRDELRVPLDRPGDQAGEEDAEEQEPEGAPDGLAPASDLEEVVDELEGEEAHAKGRGAGHDAPCMLGQPRCGGGAPGVDHGPDEEEGVLVEAEGEHAERHGAHACPPVPGESREVGYDHQDDDRGHPGRPGKMGVKGEAGRGQQQEPQGRDRQQPVARNRQYREGYEPVRRKDHLAGAALAQVPGNRGIGGFRGGRTPVANQMYAAARVAGRPAAYGTRSTTRSLMRASWVPSMNVKSIQSAVATRCS